MSERSTLQTQLSLLGSTHSSSSIELESAKKKVEDVEREKRDLLGVIARLEDDASTSQEELNQLRETLKTTRKDYSELENSVRDLRASETSTVVSLVLTKSAMRR